MNPKINPRLGERLALVLALLVISALSCQMPNLTGGGNLKGTQDALNAQATTQAQAQLTATAEKASLQAEQTSVASTSQAQAVAQSTPTPTPTATIGFPPTMAASSTPTSPVSLEPISITDWKMTAWVLLNSSCHFPNARCWRMLDEKYEDTWLTSRTPFYIDPAWKNPYLVFWHKARLFNEARLDIQADGKWSALRDFSALKSDWKQEAIDLKSFKGKNITIQFYAAVWYYTNQWWVQEVQIVPDYKP